MKKTTIFCRECGAPRIIDVRNKSMVTRCIVHQYRKKLLDNARRIEENRKARVLMTTLPSRCALCGKKNGLTIDHALPRSMGGKTEIMNLRWLCKKCNHKAYWQQRLSRWK